MGIAQAETGFGQNLGPSIAGAGGNMQFMPDTRTMYMDGILPKGLDPWGPRGDPIDNSPEAIDMAVHSAAIYLKRGGAPEDINAAIFSYNHADWYVDLVNGHAKQYADLDQIAGKQVGSIAPTVKFKNKTVPLKGPYSGSRALVRLITGAPHLRGDHAGTEFGEGPVNENVHEDNGDHNRPDGYAQDINGDNPRENEPPFSQATMDTIVSNLRSLGAEDVPDLQIGEGGTFEVQGYSVYVEPVSNHIHVGAHPIGPAPGTVDVGSSGITSAMGSSMPTSSAVAIPATTSSGGITTSTGTGIPSLTKEPKPKFSQNKLLNAIGKDQGFLNLVSGQPTEAAPAEEDATMAAMAEIAATRKRLLKR
jgi:hypothetical protein